MPIISGKNEKYVYSEQLINKNSGNMNTYLLKFSDGNMRHEKMIDKFNKSLKNPKPKKKDKKKIKHIEINHAKGLSYSDFLASEYWHKVRAMVLNRDNNECVICHTKINLRVHHETYIHHGFEHKHLEDLTTLCNEHHRIRHGIIELHM